MLLFLVAYLGGALTILSPCILPVLPFVFARADKPFIRSGLPMLAGMAITFAAVATLAAVAGGWAVEANRYGRFAAVALLAGFGLTLLFPPLSDAMTRPLVALGSRLSQSASDGSSRFGGSLVPSVLLGIATGLLWAPCAGPILGLLLTGAALGGANVGTSILLLAYAAGAATSLAGAILVGGKLFGLMKRSLGAGEWVRRGLGVAVLAGVAAIALGLDTGLLTRLSYASTASIEQHLVERAGARPPETVAAISPRNGSLPVEGQLPSLSGAVEWLNSPPLTAEGLRGKVVLVDFWTYSCINCLRAIPYVKAWADKYKDQGLVVIGVHAPEFAFEQNIDNVRRATRDLGVTYPVAIDNNYALWRAFNNNYWPAHYFVDAQGRIRHHHFGEGEYDRSEAVIQQLLAEAGRSGVATDIVAVKASGAETAAGGDVKSPETYLGYGRGENFASAEEVAEDARRTYSIEQPLELNEWGLSGDWTIGKDHATVETANGRLNVRFHARDLHLVLGPADAGKPIRFRITIDGHAPDADAGMDVDPQGNGTITAQRLYQLVRQTVPVADHLFEIEFLDAGAQAYAVTFG